MRAGPVPGALSEKSELGEQPYGKGAEVLFLKAPLQPGCLFLL